MTRFMNDIDLNSARARFGRGLTPNRLALAIVVEHLAAWSDEHSDGWAYWEAPRKAADKAMEHIDSTTWPAMEAQERKDITDEELKAAVRPIKSFLTRHKASSEDLEFILRTTTTIGED